MKFVNFSNPTQNQPHSLVIMDEAMLRTLLQEEIQKVIRKMKEEESKPMTRQETMEYLGIKATSLWNMQKQGKLNPVRINGKVLFERKEVISLAKRKEVYDNDGTAIQGD